MKRCNGGFAFKHHAGRCACCTAQVFVKIAEFLALLDRDEGLTVETIERHRCVAAGGRLRHSLCHTRLGAHRQQIAFTEQLGIFELVAIQRRDHQTEIGDTIESKVLKLLGRTFSKRHRHAGIFSAENRQHFG